MDLPGVERLLANDSCAMEALHAAASLDLPDWWIGAGFVRNRVWDHLSGRSNVRPDRDVDLVYFDADHGEPERDQELERVAGERFPGVPWEIRNQARMHSRNGDAPYTDSLDAISNWPETATCVAARLVDGQVQVVARHGVADLVTLVARPSPRFATAGKAAVVAQRIERKGWIERWPELRIEDGPVGFVTTDGGGNHVDGVRHARPI